MDQTETPQEVIIKEPVPESMKASELNTHPAIAGKANIDDVRNIPPRTTAEQDRKSSGQREINLIWEHTQRHIAVGVTFMACLISGIIIVANVLKDMRSEIGSVEPSSLVLAAFTLLSNISFLVAGFYFGRTNHARIGDEKDRSSSGAMDTR